MLGVHICKLIWLIAYQKMFRSLKMILRFCFLSEPCTVPSQGWIGTCGVNWDVGLEPEETKCLHVSPSPSPMYQFTPEIPIHPVRWYGIKKNFRVKIFKKHVILYTDMQKGAVLKNLTIIFHKLRLRLGRGNVLNLSLIVWKIPAWSLYKLCS